MNGRFLKFSALAFTAAATMFANTVTVTVTSSGVSPYTGTVGGTPNVQIICDDPYDILTTSQTTDNVLFLNQLNSSNYLQTRYGAAILANQGNNVGAAVTLATKLYDEVAYLALHFGKDNTINTAIQIAIWHVFDNLGITATDHAPAETGPLNSTNQDDSNYWYRLATAASGISFGAAHANQIEILTPPGALGANGGSQEFIVVTPEPATYTMLGSGIILLSLVTFRRRRNRAS